MGEWISVEDRMPLNHLKEGEDFESIEVIVTDGITVGTCDCQAGYAPKPWVAFSSYSDVKGTEITHWMYFPKPPQD